MNVELGKLVLKQITEHPETHHQAFWQYSACGTTRCIAGWACHLSGYEVNDNGYVMDTNGVTETPVPTLARSLLDISFTESLELFHERNDNRAIDILSEWIEAAESTR